jgi:hypothetical protein
VVEPPTEDNNAATFTPMLKYVHPHRRNDGVSLSDIYFPMGAISQTPHMIEKMSISIGTQLFSSKNTTPTTTHSHIPTSSPAQRFAIPHISNIGYTFTDMHRSTTNL